jgi:hypothetical protein
MYNIYKYYKMTNEVIAKLFLNRYFADFFEVFDDLSEIKRSSVTQDELKSPKTRKRRKSLKRVLKLAQIYNKTE